MSSRDAELRAAMLGDAEFVAGILEGYEEIRRGEGISLEQLKRELGVGTGGWIGGPRLRSGQATSPRTESTS